MVFTFKDHMFSPQYREAVRIIKKAIKDNLRDEVKYDDIRTSEGAGKQGPAERASVLPKSRYIRRNTRAKPRPVDREKENDRDTGTASTPNAAV